MMIEAGKTYPLRGGLTARISFTDKKGNRPISGLVDVGEYEDHQTWYADGHVLLGGNSDFDIVMPKPERESRWINWYGTSSGGTGYKTREEAGSNAGNFRTHVLEIIIENGELVDVKIHKVER
jgi:hypothetical protein